MSFDGPGGRVSAGRWRWGVLGVRKGLVVLVAGEGLKMRVDGALFCGRRRCGSWVGWTEMGAQVGFESEIFGR